MKRRWVILLPGSVALAVVVALLWPREQEPMYEGRTLSQWLAAYRPGGPLEEAAFHAVRQIGTNALPWLIRWGRDGSFRMPRWKVRLFHVLERTSLPASTKLTIRLKLLGEDLPDPVLVAFEILREQAAPAIPQLAALKDPRGVDWAMWAMAWMGEPGLLAVCRALTDPQTPRRERAARLYSHMAERSSADFAAAIPLLIQCLKDEEPGVAEAAARVLGLIGANHREQPAADAAVLARVISALRESLGDPRGLVRDLALESLVHIQVTGYGAVPGLARRGRSCDFQAGFVRGEATWVGANLCPNSELRIPNCEFRRANDQ